MQVHNSELLTCYIGIRLLKLFRKLRGVNKLSIPFYLRLVHLMLSPGYLDAKNLCHVWFSQVKRKLRIKQMLTVQCILLLQFPCTAHVTNEDVRARIARIAGPTETLMTTVKKIMLKWFSHVCRQWHTCQCHPRWIRKRKTETRKTKIKMDRQHQRMDTNEHNRGEENG